MPLSIDLPDQLETWLRNRAQNAGTTAETLAARAVEERWAAASRADALGEQESELLLRIQDAFPPDETREFHELCRRNDVGLLTETERPRYRELLRRREEQNAARLRALGDLAALRGVTLDELMDQLQIVPANV